MKTIVSQISAYSRTFWTMRSSASSGICSPGSLISVMRAVLRSNTLRFVRTAPGSQMQSSPAPALSRRSAMHRPFSSNRKPMTLASMPISRATSATFTPLPHPSEREARMRLRPP